MPEGKKRIRSFVAVLLDPSLKEEIARTQEQLKAVGANVRWVAPETFHFTLKFLGGVEEEKIEEIAQTVGAVAAQFQPFSLSLAGLGVYPSLSAPRVIWVGTSQGAQELTELGERTEAALEPMGFEREKRPFSAHLTLGRVRSPKRRAELSQAIQAVSGGSLPGQAGEPSFGEMKVDRVWLMKSDLTLKGAIHTPLKEMDLGGQAPTGLSSRR